MNQNISPLTIKGLLEGVGFTLAGKMQRDGESFSYGNSIRLTLVFDAPVDKGGIHSVQRRRVHVKLPLPDDITPQVMQMKIDHFQTLVGKQVSLATVPQNDIVFGMVGDDVLSVEDIKNAFPSSPDKDTGKK